MRPCAAGGTTPPLPGRRRAAPTFCHRRSKRFVRGAGADRPAGRAMLRRPRPPSPSPRSTDQAPPRAMNQNRERTAVNVLDEIVADQIRSDLPELASGDTVKVSARVVEGGKERIQVFEGTVMRLKGGGIARSITVRKIASGVGVERTFMVNSPRVEKIEVVRHGRARRAQLYFLRKRVGKAATLRERRARGQAPTGRAQASAASKKATAADAEPSPASRPKSRRAPKA